MKLFLPILLCTQVFPSEGTATVTETIVVSETLLWHDGYEVEVEPKEFNEGQDVRAEVRSILGGESVKRFKADAGTTVCIKLVKRAGSVACEGVIYYENCNFSYGHLLTEKVYFTFSAPVAGQPFHFCVKHTSTEVAYALPFPGLYTRTRSDLLFQSLPAAVMLSVTGPTRSQHLPLFFESKESGVVFTSDGRSLSDTTTLVPVGTPCTAEPGNLTTTPYQGHTTLQSNGSWTTASSIGLMGTTTTNPHISIPSGTTYHGVAYVTLPNATGPFDVCVSLLHSRQMLLPLLENATFPTPLRRKIGTIVIVEEDVAYTPTGDLVPSWGEVTFTGAGLAQQDTFKHVLQTDFVDNGCWFTGSSLFWGDDGSPSTSYGGNNLTSGEAGSVAGLFKALPATATMCYKKAGDKTGWRVIPVKDAPLHSAIQKPVWSLADRRGGTYGPLLVNRTTGGVGDAVIKVVPAGKGCWHNSKVRSKSLEEAYYINLMLPADGAVYVCFREGTRNWVMLDTAITVTTPPSLTFEVEGLVEGADVGVVVNSVDSDLYPGMDVMRIVPANAPCEVLTDEVIRPVQGMRVMCPVDGASGLSRPPCTASFENTPGSSFLDRYLTTVFHPFDDVAPITTPVSGVQHAMGAVYASKTTAKDLHICYKQHAKANWIIHPTTLLPRLCPNLSPSHMNRKLLGGEVATFVISPFSSLQPFPGPENVKFARLTGGSDCLSLPTDTLQSRFSGSTTNFTQTTLAEGGYTFSVLTPQVAGSYYLCVAVNTSVVEWHRYGRYDVVESGVVYSIEEARNQGVNVLMLKRTARVETFNTSAGSDIAKVIRVAEMCGPHAAHVGEGFDISTGTTNLGPTDAITPQATLHFAFPATERDLPSKDYKICVFTNFPHLTDRVPAARDVWVEAVSESRLPLVTVSAEATKWETTQAAETGVLLTSFTVTTTRHTETSELRVTSFNDSHGCLGKAVDVGSVVLTYRAGQTEVVFHAPLVEGVYSVCFRMESTTSWVQLTSDAGYGLVVNKSGVEFSALPATVSRPQQSVFLHDLVTGLGNASQLWCNITVCRDRLAVVPASRNCPPPTDSSASWFLLTPTATPLTTTLDPTVTTFVLPPPYTNDTTFKICLLRGKVNEVYRTTDRDTGLDYLSLPNDTASIFAGVSSLATDITLAKWYNSSAQFIKVSEDTIQAYRSLNESELRTPDGFLSNSPVLQSGDVVKITADLFDGINVVSAGGFPVWVVKCPKSASWDDDSLHCLESTVAKGREAATLVTTSFLVDTFSDEVCPEEYGWGSKGLKKFMTNGEAGFNLRFRSGCPQNVVDGVAKLPNPGCGIRLAAYIEPLNKTIYTPPMWFNVEPHPPDSVIVDGVLTNPKSPPIPAQDCSSSSVFCYKKLCTDRKPCTLSIQAKYKGNELYSPTDGVKVIYSEMDYGVTGDSAGSLVQSDFESTSWSETDTFWREGGVLEFGTVPILRQGRNKAFVYLNITSGGPGEVVWTRVVIEVARLQPARVHIVDVRHLEVSGGVQVIPPPVIQLVDDGVFGTHSSYVVASEGSYVEALHPVDIAYVVQDAFNESVEYLQSWHVSINMVDDDMSPISGNSVLNVVTDASGLPTTANSYTSPAYSTTLGPSLPLRAGYSLPDSSARPWGLQFRVLNNKGCRRSTNGCNIMLRLARDGEELTAVFRTRVRVRGCELMLASLPEKYMSDSPNVTVFPGTNSEVGWLPDEFTHGDAFFAPFTNHHLFTSSVVPYGLLSDPSPVYGSWGAVIPVTPKIPCSADMTFHDTWGLISARKSFLWKDDAALQCISSAVATLYFSSAETTVFNISAWSGNGEKYSPWPTWDIVLGSEVLHEQGSIVLKEFKIVPFTNTNTTISPASPMATFTLKLEFPDVSSASTANTKILIPITSGDQICHVPVNIIKTHKPLPQRYLKVAKIDGAEQQPDGSYRTLVGTYLEFHVQFMKKDVDEDEAVEPLDGNFTAVIGGTPVVWRCGDSCATQVNTLRSTYPDITGTDDAGSTTVYTYGSGKVTFARSAGYHSAPRGRGYIGLYQTPYSGLCKACEIQLCPALVTCSRSCSVNDTREEAPINMERCTTVVLHVEPVPPVVYKPGIVSTTLNSNSSLYAGALLCGFKATVTRFVLLTYVELHSKKYMASTGALYEVQYRGQVFANESGWHTTASYESTGATTVALLVGVHALGYDEVFIISVSPRDGGSGASVSTSRRYQYVLYPEVVSTWALRDAVTSKREVCTDNLQLAYPVDNYLKLRGDVGEGWRYADGVSVGLPVPFETEVLNELGLRAATFGNTLIKIEKHDIRSCNDGGGLALHALKDQSSTGIEMTVFDPLAPFETTQAVHTVSGLSKAWLSFTQPCQKCRMKFSLCLPGASLTECLIGTPDVPPVISERVKITKEFTVLSPRAESVIVSSQSIPDLEAVVRVGDPFTFNFEAVQLFSGWALRSPGEIELWVVARHSTAANKYGSGGFLSTSPDATQCSVPTLPPHRWTARTSTNTITAHFTRPCSKCTMWVYYKIRDGMSGVFPVRSWDGVVLERQVMTCGLSWRMMVMQPLVRKGESFSTAAIYTDQHGHPDWDASTTLSVQNVQGFGNGAGGDLVQTYPNTTDIATFNGSAVVRLHYTRACSKCSFVFGDEVRVAVLSTPTQVIVEPLTELRHVFTAANRVKGVVFDFEAFAADENLDRSYAVGGPVYLSWLPVYLQQSVLPAIISVPLTENVTVSGARHVSTGRPGVEVTKGSIVFNGIPTGDTVPGVMRISLTSFPLTDYKLRLHLSGHQELPVRSMLGEDITLSWSDPVSTDVVVVFPQLGTLRSHVEYIIKAYAVTSVDDALYHTTEDEGSATVSVDLSLCPKCIIGGVFNKNFQNGESELSVEATSGSGVVVVSVISNVRGVERVESWKVSIEPVVFTQWVMHGGTERIVGEEIQLVFQAFDDLKDELTAEEDPGWVLGKAPYLITDCFDISGAVVHKTLLIVTGQFPDMGACVISDITDVGSTAILQEITVTVTSPPTSFTATHPPVAYRHYPIDIVINSLLSDAIALGDSRTRAVLAYDSGDGVLHSDLVTLSNGRAVVPATFQKTGYWNITLWVSQATSDATAVWCVGARAFRSNCTSETLLLHRAAETQVSVEMTMRALVVYTKLHNGEWVEGDRAAIIGDTVTMRVVVTDGVQIAEGDGLRVTVDEKGIPCVTGDRSDTNTDKDCTRSGTCELREPPPCRQQHWDIQEPYYTTKDGVADVAGLTYTHFPREETLLARTQLQGVPIVVEVKLDMHKRSAIAITGQHSCTQDGCQIPLSIGVNKTVERLRSGIYNQTTLQYLRVEIGEAFDVNITVVDEKGNTLLADGRSRVKLFIECEGVLAPSFQYEVGNPEAEVTGGIASFHNVKVKTHCHVTRLAVTCVEACDLEVKSAPFESGDTSPVVQPDIWDTMGFYVLVKSTKMNENTDEMLAVFEESLRQSFLKVEVQVVTITISYFCNVPVDKISLVKTSYSDMHCQMRTASVLQLVPCTDNCYYAVSFVVSSYSTTAVVSSRLQQFPVTDTPFSQAFPTATEDIAITAAPTSVPVVNTTGAPLTIAPDMTPFPGTPSPPLANTPMSECDRLRPRYVYSIIITFVVFLCL